MPRSKSSARKKPRSNPRGTLKVHIDGYGFVQTAEGEYFIPRKKLGYAFDGDFVEIAKLPSRASKGSPYGQSSQHCGRPAARIVRILGRAHDVLIGRYEVAEPFGVVVPEDPRIAHDIFTMRADNPDIPNGSLVRVRIVTFPARNTAATGVIEEVLEQSDVTKAGIDVIIAHHALETTFSEAALLEASALEVDVQGALASGYRDLSDRFTMTIDPEDARDYDDALSIEKTSQGWRLGVHIADVAHYVGWNSSLDLNARRRGCSVYLADRVIPMLPEKLSGDICSLVPGQLRRTMTVDLYVDDNAGLLQYEIYPALICSNARLNYKQAFELLQEGDDEMAPRLRALSALAAARKASRALRGGMDFATVEARAALDEEGLCVGVDLRRKNEATQLVEEAMIFANEVVAQFILEHDFPSLYRVHEKPAPDALAGLVPVFNEFAWFDDLNESLFVAGNPHTLCEVLKRVRNRREEELVSSLVLRSMKRAIYKAQWASHFGLASECYTHFTSPIRRYPDLMVHRALKAILAGQSKDRYKPAKDLVWIAEHSSDMERVAEAAARQSQEYKIIEYLQQFVGTCFAATISGVATYGVYVRLDNTMEGLLPVSALGQEYFALDPVRHCLTGQQTLCVWQLGNRLSVRLKEADPRTRMLVFDLA